MPFQHWCRPAGQVTAYAGPIHDVVTSPIKITLARPPSHVTFLIMNCNGIATGSLQHTSHLYAFQLPAKITMPKIAVRFGLWTCPHNAHPHPSNKGYWFIHAMLSMDAPLHVFTGHRSVVADSATRTKPQAFSKSQWPPEPWLQHEPCVHIWHWHPLKHLSAARGNHYLVAQQAYTKTHTCSDKEEGKNTHVKADRTCRHRKR